MVRRLIDGVAAAVLAGVLAWAAPSAAQEVPCVGLEDGLPCGFEIEALAVGPVPALFELQARISQAQLPVGDRTFQTVVVQALAGDDVVCQEEIPGVELIGSVLNLTIGQGMTCDLSRVIAERPSVAFRVCLDGAAQCLKPIELSTAPYALRSTWASLAQEAPLAEVAGRASYAHRATADRDMLARRMIRTGYFDFATPYSNSLGSVVPAQEASQYTEGGFLQWTPAGASDGAGFGLHVAAKDQASDTLAPLDELVLVAERTVARGDLVVAPPEDGNGLVVVAGGMDVGEAVGFDDALDATGGAVTGGHVAFLAHAKIDGALQIGGDAEAGAAQVTGASDAGALVAGGPLALLQDLVVQGDVSLDGALTAASLAVSGGLALAGALGAATLVAGELEIGGPVAAAALAVTGPASVGGDLTVGGGLTVGGPTVFQGHVVFPGAVAVGGGGGGGGGEPAYVLAEGEARDLTFGGAVAFDGGATLGAAMDLQGHQLLAYRVEAAASAPVACDAQHEGAVFLDSATGRLTACAGGAWVAPGGPVCGDGFVGPGEACDDGDTDPGDGCDATCQVEPVGWVCTPASVQPSVCTPSCGDGVLTAAAGEACDDGGTAAGDGCDAACQIEPDAECSGEPSVCFLHGSAVFEYVPGGGCWQYWTPPAGVTSVTFEARGAQGGGVGGGWGAVVTGTLLLEPGGPPLAVVAGSKGEDDGGFGACGWGGSGGDPIWAVAAVASGGGGYSGIFRGVSNAHEWALVVAGGGGGSYEKWGSYPLIHAGGHAYCWGGQTGEPWYKEYAGGGASPFGPGAAGVGHCEPGGAGPYPPTAGGQLKGGHGGGSYADNFYCPAGVEGGGGGGGWFGGGGGGGEYSSEVGQGFGSSGGGGSSWYDPGRVEATCVPASGFGHGQVTITW